MNCSTQQLLSKRELEILHLVSNEYTIKEIAAQLFISAHTVISHRQNIQSKLDVKNTAGMIRRAFELNFLSLSNHKN